MKLRWYSVFMLCRTVPLLERGPLHVDVGFVRKVDLTGSFENGPGLVHILRLQVLIVLNDTYENMLHRDLSHIHVYTHTQWWPVYALLCVFSRNMTLRQTHFSSSPWSRTPHTARRRSDNVRRVCEPCCRPGQPQHPSIPPGAGLWPPTPRSLPALDLKRRKWHSKFLNAFRCYHRCEDPLRRVTADLVGGLGGLWCPYSAERSPSLGRSARPATGGDPVAWHGSKDVWSTGQR